LLTTDLKTSAKRLVQYYFDRWQIEVNHRDEKTLLAVGQAQVWSERSVSRQPAFAVASYSLLLLASLRCSGPGRCAQLHPLPKWRTTSPSRASFQDVLTRLRKELYETSVCATLDVNFVKNITLYSKT
jgi:hypothetical protein